MGCLFWILLFVFGPGLLSAAMEFLNTEDGREFAGYALGVLFLGLLIYAFVIYVLIYFVSVCFVVGFLFSLYCFGKSFCKYIFHIRVPKKWSER